MNKNRKRRVVVESSDDDDFVEPLPQKKKDDKRSKIQTKKHSKKVEQGKKPSQPEPPRTEPRASFEYNNEAILLRCQPTSYMDTMKNFSKEQVDEVKNMGFGLF
ncbi:hypothetical protein Hanom_Chr15g01338011 [Helianthus anomalus]